MFIPLCYPASPYHLQFPPALKYMYFFGKKMESEQCVIETEDLDERLITEIQEYDFIYKKESVHHKDKRMVKNAWLELATKLNIPAEVLQRRWFVLRQRFAKERRKMMKRIDSKSTWIHYHSLQFLDSVVKRRSTASCFVCSVDQADNSDTSMDVMASVLVDDLPAISPLLHQFSIKSPPSTTTQNHSTPVTNNITNKRKFESIEEMHTSGAKLPQSVQFTSNEPDINTAFAQYVGHALKTKSLERQRFLRSEFWRLLEEQ